VSGKFRETTRQLEGQLLAETPRTTFQYVTTKSDRVTRPKPQKVTELVPE